MIETGGMIENVKEAVKDFLSGWLTGQMHSLAVNCVMLVGIAVCAVASYYLLRTLLRLLEAAVQRTPTKWDDDILTPRLMRAVSQLAPAVVVSVLLPGFFGDTPATLHWLDVLTSFYILWMAVRMLLILIGNLFTAFSKRPHLKIYAVKGVFQMIKLIVLGLGVIVGLSILIGKTPIAILTALGASAAVLMLVFKDTILGLVASVQLTANNMLQRGDWIVVPGHGANGEVIDISLSTVKVRNWDNSITTVPPYSLISDSFQNFRPMQESGGRRVDRAVYIDINSVRFCTPGELNALRELGLLDGIDIQDLDHTVNLQILRHYLERYIATHPEVNPQLTNMVRQLAPTQAGLPLQLYFFTHTTAWKDYERIQSDIFDHVYAVVGHFGLTIYQAPTGRDLLTLANVRTQPSA